MNIYVVQRKEGTVDWDEYIGFVVAANDPQEARALCANFPSTPPNSWRANHTPEPWGHPDTTCTPIGVALPSMIPSVLFESFNAA